jgi:hypothetical protein
MLGSDSRDQVETGLIADRRVRHFWDGQRTVGRWFADSGIGELGYSGIVWDAYYVFGPAAVWNERPGPAAGFGSPVISSTGTLERALRRLLG